MFFACVIFLLSLIISPASLAAGDDYTKNIDIVEASIKKNYKEFPVLAYLYLTLKNNGDRKVSNVILEVSYFGEENYLIQKTIIKDVLNDIVPQGESRNYRIRLRGDFVNIENEQYPYSKNEKVDEFDIKIIKVRFAK
jgi:hypothetical protein